MEKRKAIATKFVKWDIPTLDSLRDSKAYILREKLNKGEKLTRQEKDWVTEKVNFNSYSMTGIPLRGWMFDFSDVLRCYIVKQYGHWTEHNAIDKSSLRNALYGRIERIEEIDRVDGVSDDDEEE